MKLIFLALSAILTIGCVATLMRGLSAFGQAASSAGASAQGGAFGVILFAILLGGLAWMAFSKARAA